MPITIIEDTRNVEDKWQFVKEEWKEKGINVFRSKLPFGDYARIDKMSVIVDTKKDIMELEMDMTRDHVRFRKECDEAAANGIKLYILVIDEYIYNLDGVKHYKIPTYKGNQYKDINGVKICTHKRGEKRANFNPETLEKALKTFQEKHGCTFIFCKKENVAKKILTLLGVK